MHQYSALFSPEDIKYKANNLRERGGVHILECGCGLHPLTPAHNKLSEI